MTGRHRRPHHGRNPRAAVSWHGGSGPQHGSATTSSSSSSAAPWHGGGCPQYGSATTSSSYPADALWHGGAPQYGGATTLSASGAAASINPYSPNLPFAANPMLFPHLFLQTPPALAAYRPGISSYLQNPSLQPPNGTFQPSAASTPPTPRPPSTPPQRNQHAVIERAQAAARKARDELVQRGESVTGWKVAQAVLVALKADSWSALGLQLQEVALLRELFLTEGKVNTFIHCYVAARKIISLYDLEAEICKNEGVGQFEELGLGPFLRHPLVVHYFSAPADLTTVPKLSSEEIIVTLQKFMFKSKKKITVEEFLDYLAEQKSISGKENLGVRIQSLGLHISFLSQARRNELAAAKQLCKTSGNSSQERDLPQTASFLLGKRELDQRFDGITSRMKSLSKDFPDFSGKHIRFDSTDDEIIDGDSSSEDCQVDDSKNKNVSSVGNDRDINKPVSSCPYPSTTEEMKRLGLISEMSKKPSEESGKTMSSGKEGYSSKKRKYEENESSSSWCKRPKKQKKAKMKKQEVASTCFLSVGKLERFITTWKEACREHSIQQVLELLVNYYAETPTQRKKITKFFSQYPGIGLLNVAARSMGCGLLDSLYDVINVFGENKLPGPAAIATTEVIEIKPPSKENAVQIPIGAGDKLGSHNEGKNELGYSVTIDDVIKRVTEYFESDSGVFDARVLHIEKSISLKRLHDCETWVTSQFLAKKFSALGHGTFLGFLEKHGHLFPPKLSSFLKGELCGSSSLEVSVLQQQIGALLCQAGSSWMEKGNLAEDDFTVFLKNQFPTISFDVMQNKSGEGLIHFIERLRETRQRNNMHFSVTLLEKRWCGSLSGNYDNVAGLRNDVGQQSSYVASVSSQQAIDCLLKAPMLSDLLLWSHWDMLYAPTLGSFMHWLLNTGPIEELSCIVTRDGRFIRIEPSATVDQFLEAIIQCSPFQVALKLLSLLHIYDGSRNAPISLLKCYAQRAIDVIMNSNIDLVKADSEGKKFIHEKPHSLSIEQSSCSNPRIGRVEESSEMSYSRSIQSESLSKSDKTVHLVAKFILECLGHLPSEFWSLAADILLAGLRPVTKNCCLAILRECTETWQRWMLHDIGLSLGVSEWVEDYRELCSTEDTHAERGNYSSACTSSMDMRHASAVSTGPIHEKYRMLSSSDCHLMDERGDSLTAVKDKVVATLNNENHKTLDIVQTEANPVELDANRSLVGINLEEAANVIETIRRDEFGLDPTLSYAESSLLRKQHARLGRALHCLSQELYSQDSHLLLELLQNADDNTYLEDVEPTLVFVLHENGIVVLNNERGFSAENIRALCDIGNSTKKGSNGGYIGNKGIGFKSVFRVTDAPEIHSNGFHVKFDITEGQIGFVLPTVVPPYDVNSFSRMVCIDEDENNCSMRNTCILLPFRPKFREGTGMRSIVSMFSDLHPSLLLFLHRLKCIKFKDMLSGTLLVMRRKSLGDGIVKISHGDETMSWLVVSKKLEGSIIRHDVHTTEVSLAFTLHETEKGKYEPYLKQQPVFAFLPLRNYGLKFILQGDFVLPSSREEVDADSAWNQWLLSEFPSLFVSAHKSFCALPCFERCPGKAVTAFMSFVPLGGEVHGFFSQFPHLILSKLRLTRCMVLEGSSLQWVYPCNTLRGWDEQARMLLSDGLLHDHLGLGYLSKDINISDTLSRALGIQEYGPKILTEVISSMCRTDGCIKSLGMEWLYAWFITLNSTLLSHSSRNPSSGLEGDLLCSLRKVPFIPLSDGSYSCIGDGLIWLPYDMLSAAPKCISSIQDFPILYANLRTVSPLLLSASTSNRYLMEEMRPNDLMDILLKIGVRKLSAHDIIKNHILVSLSNSIDANTDRKTMIEYASFIMLHMQSSCASCTSEKEEIMSELRRKPFLLTNHGYKCPSEEPVHFGKDYGNSVDIEKLLHNVDVQWHELDSSYLMHHASNALSFGLKKWRQFFQEMGVTDFIQVVPVERNSSQVDSCLTSHLTHDNISGTTIINHDWESPELASMLSIFSSMKCRENCIYLLEVLDKLWDDYYAAKVRSVTTAKHSEKGTVESSLIKCIRNYKWIASSMDDDLHYATDLFCDFENVRSLLGGMAPYAVPQVSSRSLRKDIGFKTTVSHSDALMMLNYWISTEVPFNASMDQMCKFYTFISEGVVDAKVDVKLDSLSRASIFTPLCFRRSSEVIPGKFSSPNDLYWHDPTGCFEITKELISTAKKSRLFPRKMLSAAYPSLCEFFTETCGVPKVPTTSEYLEILLQLSNVALPSQVANQVFCVFVRWANDLHSGVSNMSDILYLKESLHKLDTTILPTLVDKWVSLHPSFGLVCWVDDDELKQHFKNSNAVDFIQFGELSSEDRQLLFGKVAVLMQSLGIPALSKLVSREAIFYGTGDSREKASLINWLLPYMQRYIYKMHKDTYLNFKQNEIEKLDNLQVIVVEKLFHKYMLKGRESSSKRRFECFCLLQGNFLYATQDADSHSVFLELSRLFFGGSSDLHFANFLHMVKTMAKSGSTREQIEFFIVNSQNVPELPEQETVWSFSSFFAADEGANSQTVGEVPSARELNISKHQLKPGIISSWPPTDWKTAPDIRQSRRKQSHFTQQTTFTQQTAGYDVGPSLELSKPVECGQVEETLVPIELEGDWVIEEGLTIERTVVLEDPVATHDEPRMAKPVDSVNEMAYLELEPGSSSRYPMVALEPSDFDEKLAESAEERDVLCVGVPDAYQLRRTGRLGESVVHNYFVRQLGSSNVRWVNEESETGLPYDIVITHKEDVIEYVEVKATMSSKKDWFHITSREWQFALEKGDSFSIAHVVLSGPKKASVVMLKNPYKLCQQKALHLALLMSRHHKTTRASAEENL